MKSNIRIIFVNTAFTPQMAGYAGMALPKAIAALPGTDVHVVAPNLNVYYNSLDYSEVYEPFLGPPETACGVEKIDGFTLHRLPHHKFKGQVFIRGLGKKISDLKPDVIQAWSVNGPICIQLIFLKLFYRFKFFTAQHTTKSVFPIANQSNISIKLMVKNFMGRVVPGRIISWMTDGCYPATKDCLDIAINYMGVQPSKCSVRNLGINTDLFYPIDTTEEEIDRQKLREELNIDSDEILCIYTGRFSEDKNPLCLALAVEKLFKNGHRYRALFIGEGPQNEVISSCASAIILKFLNYAELPPYYRIADIGVWPTQESTSMLDAAASGIPIIVSDQLVAVERINGNGLTYRQNDVDDLARVLLSLMPARCRSSLGKMGSRKMCEMFSWKAIAQRTLYDFNRSITSK